MQPQILARIDFEGILKELQTRGVKIIGIQLPDGLKYWSSEIAAKFEAEGFEVILSASPTYGACDIDVSLLQDVEVLLHFAHEPIFELDRVIYVPYRIDFDERSVENLNIPERKIALIATAQYAWKLEAVKSVLEAGGYEVEIGGGSDRIKLPGQVLGCNYTVLRDTTAEAVLFIGDGLFHPIGAAMYTGRKVYRFSPLSNEFEEVEASEFLKERMFAVARAMDAENFGIIVSSKIGQKRLGLARKLKEKVKKAGKKADIIVADVVSVANFNYDCFVNTACPRIAYDDWRNFQKPVLTPLELEIVLGLRSWGDYAMDEIL
ncbi:diphthamide biosynthesis enzyme Dph2 [Archaeoglobus veneficus]|nr:diphthamide biosynthesis enzyme Dph2 [Archaeoglobus veneficus]